MSKSEEKIIETAHKRFTEGVERDAHCRRQRLDAIKFSRLFQQWPDEVVRDRSTPGQERPMHVIPRTHQLRNQIINEIRANTPAIKIRPVGDESDPETAEIIQGVIRHIQTQSNAEVATDTAVEHQVDAGLGYFRVITDYCDDVGFDQEIYIKRIEDPFTVVMGPHVEPDGSDAKWAFITVQKSRLDFEAENPAVKLPDWDSANNLFANEWIDKDSIRVGEYYEIEEKERTLLQLADGSTAYKDELEAVPPELVLRSRPVKERRCIHRMLAGDQVLSETEIPSSYIPIIPVLGNEVWIGGKRHLHGLTQLVMESQRQYNYLQSANSEQLALAPKAPFIAAEGQIEGHEAEFRMANRVNLSVLTYKPITLQGNLAPPPQRQNPPPTSPGLEAGMARAIDDMKACAGIYDASLGNRESDQSGRAIISQQRQASIGNFHFSDNLKRSLHHLGKILLEMAFTHPLHVYDTRRIMRIVGEDDEIMDAVIDPEQEEAVKEIQHETGEVEKIFNPAVGKYDVVIDTGPSYTTRRQESSVEMLEFARMAPNFIGVAGDLLVKQLDWPNAEAISKRLKKALPPQLQEDEEDKNSPQNTLAQQQMEQMAQQMEHMSQVLQELQSDRAIKERELAIKEYEAVTHRITAEAQLTKIPGEVEAQAIANISSQLSGGNDLQNDNDNAIQQQMNYILI